jgi:hypothetical protein
MCDILIDLSLLEKTIFYIFLIHSLPILLPGRQVKGKLTHHRLFRSSAGGIVPQDHCTSSDPLGRFAIGIRLQDRIPFPG